MRPTFTWRLAARSLDLGVRTLIMGVLNVTPDSFSDGGRYSDPARAVEHALEMLEQGADMVDVGGESTRPGAKPTVEIDEELRRVVPVIAEIRRQRRDAVISIDSYHAAVARAAIEAGADIVNDVSGFQWDPQMAATCANIGCGVVLMHMRGTPDTWRELPPLDDPVATVMWELRERAANAVQAGVKREAMVLDPGFGFGKRFENNYPLVAHFEELHKLGYPLLAGTSRKSFVGRALRKNGSDAPVAERLYGSLAAMVVTIMKGAHLVRVHDVKASVEAARMADAFLVTTEARKALKIED